MKCDNCKKSIFCATWGEIKCLVKKLRIRPNEDVSDCKDYQKRGTDEENPECQCDDCLSNKE